MASSSTGSRAQFGLLALIAWAGLGSCEVQRAGDTTIVVSEQCPNPTTQKWLTDEKTCVCVDEALTIVDGQCRDCPTCDALGFECGSVCGGLRSCGSCPASWACVDGRCQACDSCEWLGYECGPACGGELDCGTCAPEHKCAKNRCVPLTPESAACGNPQTQHFAVWLERCQCDSPDEAIVDGACVPCPSCEGRECGEICEGKRGCGYCGVGTRCEDGVCVPGVSAFVCDETRCEVSGVIDRDATFRADRIWHLRGPVRVESSGERIALTIEPGTTVIAEPGVGTSLAIRKRATLIAQGTAAEPIVFTSANPEGERAPGDWGGIVVVGSGNAGPRGVLEYVRVEFAGEPHPDEAGLFIEPAALALRNTYASDALEVRHVQAHLSAGDSFYLDGGDLPLSHLVSTGPSGDHLEFLNWHGSVGHFVAQSYELGSGHGIVGRSSENFDPPRIANVSLIGAHGSGPSGTGILLYAGGVGNIVNAVVEGWGERCFDLRDIETMLQVFSGIERSGRITVDGSLMHCYETFGHADNEPQYHQLEARLFFTEGQQNEAVYPGLVAPYDTASPDWAPGPGSRAAEGGTLGAAPYVGALPPAPEPDWTQGWTTALRE